MRWRCRELCMFSSFWKLFSIGHRITSSFSSKILFHEHSMMIFYLSEVMTSVIVHQWNNVSNPIFNVGSNLLIIPRNLSQSFSHVFKQSNGRIYHSYVCYFPFEHLHSIIPINVYSMMSMSNTSPR